MRQCTELRRAVVEAWRLFESAASLEARVSPAIPILFFGDLDAYAASPQRVLTVGLNPSLNEFPAENPFLRFPLAEKARPEDQEQYLDALSDYFRTNHYDKWFQSFEPLLNGMTASYYDRHISTALHTDICSPVATNPTWTQLSKADRRVLEDDGRRLWHDLLLVLRPNVVVLSVAKDHLKQIKFESLGSWEPIHSFKHKLDGTLCSSAYNVIGCWYLVNTQSTLFVFGRASQTPLGLIGNDHKRELGTVVAKAYRNAAYTEQRKGLSALSWTKHTKC